MSAISLGYVDLDDLQELFADMFMLEFETESDELPDCWILAL